METEIALCVRWLQCGIFQGLSVLPVGLDLIAHFVQHPQEVALSSGSADSPVDVGPDSAPVGGFSITLGPPFGIVLCLSARVLDHGDGVLPAQTVRYLPHPGVVGGGVVELFSINPGHGVDDKVVVIVSGIAVGRHYNFKTPAPQLLRQPDADLMGCLRRDLIRFEGLIPVVAYPAPRLAPQPLRFHELCGSGVLPAVQAGHIGPALRFHLVGGILHHILNGMERRQLRQTGLSGLFRVPDVVDYLVHAPMNGPDGGHSHVSRKARYRCPRSASPRPGYPPVPCGAGAHPAGRGRWPAS